MTISVAVVRLPHGQNLPLPNYQSSGAAGMDLFAAIDVDIAMKIAPGGRALIPTGLALAIPGGIEAQIRPRSGLALKYGVTVLNSPGTIDSDYRGEIKIILINLGTEIFEITRGARIAQMVFAPVIQVDFAIVDALAETVRGTGGFGSSGVHTPFSGSLP